MSSIDSDNTIIAFIGTGIMGCAMAHHLMNEGYDLVVYNRTPERAQELVDCGATWAPSVEEAVQDAGIIITMVGYPSDVEDVYMGEGGIIDSALPDAYLIDMTTSSPKLAREIHAMAAVNDLHALDAPVTGGDLGAKAATLSIMVGGDEPDFKAVLPVLSCMGETIVYHGEAGKGQYAKMANQIALAGSILGAMEAYAFSKQAGLDPHKMLETIGEGSGSSWQLVNNLPKVLADDFTPGFFVKHILKDLSIALRCADEMDLTLPGVETAYQLYDLLCIVGGADLGTQALALIYEDENTCAAHGLDWSRAEGYDEGDLEDECDDEECEHEHHHHHRHDDEDGPFGAFFSPN